MNAALLRLAVESLLRWLLWGVLAFAYCCIAMAGLTLPPARFAAESLGLTNLVASTWVFQISLLSTKDKIRLLLRDLSTAEAMPWYF